MKLPLELAPGMVGDDTDFSTGGWKSGSGVRFWRGKPQGVGGWEALSLTLLTGVCRTVFIWSDANSFLSMAFGCHNSLTVWQAGEQADITPATIYATGIITVSGTPTADQTFVVGAQTFTFKASRASAGQVTISATPATQAANIVSAITADLATVTAAAVSAVVTVTAVAGGFIGNSIVLTESATGIAVSGAGTLSGGGGFVAGQIDGTGGAGYGTGAYGVGDYGEPSTDDYYSLTWSFGARSFGELYANPRGQGIFKWTNAVASDAAPLTNAPAQCNSIAVAFTDQVMAFGCTDLGGVFNASCIRISDNLNPTIWAVSTAANAQQYYLKGNARIVRGLPIGRYFFVWTTGEMHLGTFGGTWDFEPVGTGGLAGPNAAVVVGTAAYWVSPDLQFYRCDLGGAPELLQCPIRDDFKDNAAPSQNDKIVASSVSEWGEVVWYYADARDGLGIENSRAIRLSILDGAWSTSVIARTAFTDSNPAPSPVGVTYAGQIYWHERGASDDGSALTSSLRSGGQYMDPAQSMMLLRGLWPDFTDQVGAINLTIYTRDYPQDDETTWGPYVIAANANKVDFLVSGRIFDFEFNASSSPSAWRMGKPTFDAVVTGQR